MIVSWLKKYILPKEVDFLSALSSHAMVIKKIIDDLQNCFTMQNDRYCKSILEDEHKAKDIRDNKKDSR